MAKKRKRINFSLDENVEFVPECFGNRDLPKEDQMVITLKQPGFIHKNIISPIDENGKRITDENKVIEDVFENFVVDMKNVYVNGNEVKNAKLLLLAGGAVQLLNEVYVEVSRLFAGHYINPLSNSSKTS